MTTAKQSDEQKQDQTPTREELETDVAIPASFDEVMQAVIDGYGTRRFWAGLTILERKGQK